MCAPRQGSCHFWFRNVHQGIVDGKLQDRYIGISGSDMYINV